MDFFGGDQWTESDDEEKYLPNEHAPKGVDEDCINTILHTKHRVYEDIVLSPDADTEEAQDDSLLEKYINCIHNIYVLAIISQNGKKNSHRLDDFPKGVRSDIETLLNSIEAIFSKNRIPDTIPYIDYIRNHLHVYPFIQDNSFINMK
jgi:hypothetical protein